MSAGDRASTTSIKPTYVNTSGSVGEVPLLTRLTRNASDYGTIAYLFVETLLSPFLNPSSWANPADTSANTTAPPGRGQSGSADYRRGGGGGGGGPAGGGGGSAGRGGFMSMGDLRGGGTVDGCRATCG